MKQNKSAIPTRRSFLKSCTSGVLTLATLSLAVLKPVQAARLLLSPLFKPKPAPDFALENLDGEIIKMSDYRGKVVIVNFWATWCPPCRFEIPSMQRAWNIIRKEDIVMLAVHVGGNPDRVMQFAADFDVDFPVLMDRKSKVIKQWPVRGLPTTVIVDPKGTMVLQAIGSREWDDKALLDQIRKLKG
ncbi:MAG: TlpA family protein disulfide reductase [Alphaproteobacteria bacterium]|jgi:peroxiredoxin|nr:TlpA family protein disulfide reductase [Alphaproteobacteria bacterium]